MRRALTERVKRSLRTEEIFLILEKNKDLLSNAGWIVSDPSSPRWWDGLETIDDILVSSILVQLTRWETVREVLKKLKELGIRRIEDLASLEEIEIEELIKKVNFRRAKAKRLKNIAMLVKEIGIHRLVISPELLSNIEGIGDETKEAILLFAGNIPLFPRSEYSKRVLSRLTGIRLSKNDARLLGEYICGHDLYKIKLFHAGIVSVGKSFCSNQNPKCNSCIFKEICKYNSVKQLEIV
ncbi:DNA endonuclease III [Sulfolobus acidocaldarius SUSAZ]|nr:DNA endonuclease III [Sulfolobus acidocaldarius SUSAZ]